MSGGERDAASFMVPCYMEISNPLRASFTPSFHLLPLTLPPAYTLTYFP